MFYKVLYIYKEIRANNKKDIPLKIKVLIVLVTIALVMVIVCEIKSCNVGMIIAYCVSVILACIICILSDKMAANHFEDVARDYNNKILKDFEKKLAELNIGSSICINTLIDECKEYEKMQNDTFLVRLKYIFGIAVLPLITSAGSIFLLKYHNEQKIEILILAAFGVILIFYILDSLYKAYRKLHYEYNILARDMRYDLELILAQRK